MLKYILLPALIVLSANAFFAQAPPAFFQYQAVARDGSGVLQNQTLAIQVAILKSHANGTAVYQEVHNNVPTNAFGLFALSIGSGVATPAGSSLADVDWGADTYWLRIGFQPPGQSDFLLLNAVQLLSVPYAFFAGKAANATGGDPDSTNEIQTLSKTGNQIQLSKNGGAVTDAVNDADASPTNELQALSQNGTTVTLSQNGGTISVADNDNDPANELQSLSLLGNTLSISGGNSVSLAGLGGSQWLNNPNGIHYGNLTGNVGIGTASPQTRLDIRSPDGNAEETMFNLRKDNGAGAARNFLIKMRSAVPEVVLTTDGTGGHPRLTLGPAGGASSFLTITPNENAGINTNNPEAGLDILRSNGAPALRVTKSAGTEHVAIFRRDPNPAFAPVMVMTRQGFVGLGTDAPQEALHVVGHICYTGSIFTCSDSRYKTGLQPLAGALDKISRISGQYYFWDRAGYPEKGFSDQRQIGLLAQEVEQYFPEIVHTDADGYKSVDYSRLTPVLIEALKAQQQQIERLNAQVEKLERMEARLEALEREIKRDGSE